jgi:hypothetical protein
MDHISTTYWNPKVIDNQPTGTWEYTGQRKISDVIKQVESILDTVTDADNIPGSKLAEWITQYDDDAIEFPAGEPFAAMRYGANEGYLVEVFSFDTSAGTVVPVIIVKYLSDKSLVYKLVEAVNDALWNGGFICEAAIPSVKCVGSN